MKKSKFYVIVGLILPSLFFFSSCGEKKDKSGRTDTRSSGTISFVADESFSPIIEELREQFEYKFPKATLNAQYTNEVEGMKQITDMKSNLLSCKQRHMYHGERPQENTSRRGNRLEPDISRF